MLDMTHHKTLDFFFFFKIQFQPVSRNASSRPSVFSGEYGWSQHLNKISWIEILEVGDVTFKKSFFLKHLFCFNFFYFRLFLFHAKGFFLNISSWRCVCVFFSAGTNCCLPVRGTKDRGSGGGSTHSKSGSAYSGQGCRGLTFGNG